MSHEPRHSSETNEWFSPKLIVEPSRTLMGAIDLDPASCALANRVVQANTFFDELDDGLTLAWSGRVFLNPPGGIIDGDGRRVFNKTKNRESCSVSGACGLPPGHKHKDTGAAARRWWFKLAEEWSSGRVPQAVFLGFSLDILQTTQGESWGLPVPLDFPRCYPKSRLDFTTPTDDGEVAPATGNTHASVIVWLPPIHDIERPGPIDCAREHAELFEKFQDAFAALGRCKP